MDQLNAQEPECFESGSVLIQQGQTETHAFTLESGSVKIVLKDGDQEQVLGIASIGDVVGEMALFDDAPRSASVVALEQVLARRMTREGLAEAMQKDPVASVPYLRAILDRLRTSNAMLLSAQQTKELIKTTRVRLSFEPISEAAIQVCSRKAMIEMDINVGDGSTQILIQGLQRHFKVGVETFLAHMQR